MNYARSQLDATKTQMRLEIGSGLSSHQRELPLKINEPFRGRTASDLDRLFAAHHVYLPIGGAVGNTVKAALKAPRCATRRTYLHH